MPELSVVIASHNRRSLLHRCLEHLASQSADPASFEVIVVDDGSSDGTAAMVEEATYPFVCRALRRQKGGKVAALNAGVEIAAAPACLFIDDDVIASPDLLAAHIRAHREQPAVLAIGPLTQAMPDGGSWYARAYTAAWNHRYAELAERPVQWSDCYGGNFSAPRAKLTEVGGFDTSLAAAEDLEVGYRLTRAGCLPTFVAAAHGIHDDQKSAGRMLADQVRFGELCPSLVAREPGMRSRTLAWFNLTSRREVRLRRALLALRVPAPALAAIGGALPKQRAGELWFGFVSRYCFWLGVRRACDRRQWQAITHDSGAADEESKMVEPR